MQTWHAWQRVIATLVLKVTVHTGGQGGNVRYVPWDGFTEKP
jgi:hypothetical protein